MDQATEIKTTTEIKGQKTAETSSRQSTQQGQNQVQQVQQVKKTGEPEQNGTAEKNTGTAAEKAKQKEKEKAAKNLKAGSEKVVREIKNVKTVEPAEDLFSEVKDEESERRRAEMFIELYQGKLRDAEKHLFDQEAQRSLPKSSYAAAGDLSKDKRVTEAREREKRADYIENFLRTKDTKTVVYEPVFDSAQLKDKLKNFLYLDFDKNYLNDDVNFCHALEWNFKLTHEAARIKKYVSDAMEGGYLPKGVDMGAVQKKIADFETLGEYLNTRIKVVTSPYYKYFAKKDVKYTDAQLESFINLYNRDGDQVFKQENQQILEYLMNIKALRGMKLNRKKGLKSVEGRSKQRAKHEIEILRTRSEKREVIRKLSEEALRFKGNQRFQEKDYDKRYNAAAFTALLDEFDQVKVSDLHFKSMKDLADNWAVNRRLFEKARDMEHMLFLAVHRGDADQFPDERLIRLRAKIRAFDAMERLTTRIQANMIVDSEASIHKDTYEEIVDRARRDAAIVKNSSDISGYPRLGDNLEKFYQSIVKTYQEEHKDRKSTIRTMYGLMHPERILGDGEEGDTIAIPWKPGVISEEELNERARKFQRNAVLMDYSRNLESYVETTGLTQYDAFAAAYEKKYKINPKDVIKPTRSMNRYLVGKSAEELGRLTELLARGSKEEKKAFWDGVLGEVMEVDLNSCTGDRFADLFPNMAYKNRITGIFLNLGELGKQGGPGVFDEKTAKLLRGMQEAGNSFTDSVSAIGQMGRDHRWIHGVTAEDLCYMDPSTYEMSFWLKQEWLDENGPHTAFLSDGREYVNRKNCEVITNLMSFNYLASSNRHRMVGGKDHLENAWEAKYRHLKAAGAWVDTDRETLGKLLTAIQEQEKVPSPELSDKEAALLVMGADLNSFRFTSYGELCEEKEWPSASEKKEILTPIQKLTPLVKTAERLLARLKKAGKKGGVDPEIASALGEEGRKALIARCQTLKAAGTFLGEGFGGVIKAYLEGTGADQKGASLDELLHMPSNYQVTAKKSAQGKQKAQWESIISFMKGLMGFDLFSSLSMLEEKQRRFNGVGENGLSADAVISLLNGEKSVLENVEEGALSFQSGTQAELFGRFSKVFKEDKSLTVHQREALLTREGSQQFQKHRLYRTLEEARNTYRGKLFSIKRSIPLAQRAKIGDERMEDLAALMVGNFGEAHKGMQEEMDLFASLYAEKDSRGEILDLCTKAILSFSLYIPENQEPSAETLSDHAGSFEDASCKAHAYLHLLKANPEYKKRLERKAPGEEKSDYERVMEKLDKMLAASDYFRAFRLLASDHYFILHGNTELGTEDNGKLGREQRRVLDLMKLLDFHGRKLRNDSYWGRTMDTSIDRELDALEEETYRQNFLTGRPDLTKLNAKTAQATNQKIAEFFRRSPDPSGYGVDPVFHHDPEANPEAEEVRTGEVQNYLDALKVYFALESDKIPADQMYCFASQEKKDLLKKVRNMVKYEEEIKDKDGKVIRKEQKKLLNFSFKDQVKGKTADGWGAKTGWDRFPVDLVMTLSDHLSDEELLDIVEGMTYFSLPGHERTDEATEDYARERWLRSAAKIFKIQYDEMKKVERTYGSLLTDVPPAVLMQSLGAGQKDYMLRVRFAQNFTELLSEPLCTYQGKVISLAELLKEKGLISETEYQDAFQKQPSYFQQAMVKPREFCKQPYMVLPVDEDAYEPESAIGHLDHELWHYESWSETGNLEGPHLSYAKKKKLWKDAISLDDESITGGKTNEAFFWRHFDLLSKEERRRLKEKRNRDHSIMLRSRKFLENRTETLLAETLNAMGEEKISKERKRLIRSLIPFHPGFYKDITENDFGERNTFYEKVKTFCAKEPELKGSEEEKQKALSDFHKKKREAFHYFRETAHSLVHTDLLAPKDPEDIMGKNDVRTAPDVVMDSALLKMETCHLMFDALQDAAGEQGPWFDNDAREKLRDDVFYNLRLEIIRLTMSSTFYLDLKDVGGHYETAVGRSYLKLQELGRYAAGNALDKHALLVLWDPEIMDYLGQYGIKTDGLYDTVKVAGGATLFRAEKPGEKKKAAGTAPSDTIIEEEEEEEEIITTHAKKEEEEEIITTHAKKEAKAEGSGAAPVKKQEVVYAEVQEVEKPVLTEEEMGRIYTKEAFTQHQNALSEFIRQNGLDLSVPQTRDQLVAVRKPFYGKNVTFISRDGKRRNDQTWLDGTNPILMEHFDWMMDYFKYHDKSIQPVRVEEEENLYEIPKKEYHVDGTLPGIETAYEEQEDNNCFCCTATAMLAYMLAKKNNKARYSKWTTQDMMRSYEPRIRKYDQKFEKEAGVDALHYRNKVEDLYAYCGKGKTETGNIFEAADFLLEKLASKKITDVCVNSIKYTIPSENMLKTKNGQIKKANQLEVFKKTLAENLDKKNAVGVFRAIQEPSPDGKYIIYNYHYVTVTSIDGDRIKYSDSSDGTENWASMDEFFKNTSTVELNWLSEMPSPEELTKEYENLTYSKEEGFGVKTNDPDSVLYVGHTRGVTVRKGLKQLDKGWNDIACTIYIPNPGHELPSQTKAEFDAENKALAERMKQEEKEEFEENQRRLKELNEKAKGEEKPEEYLRRPVFGSMLTREGAKTEESSDNESVINEDRIIESTDNENRIIEPAKDQPSSMKRTTRKKKSGVKKEVKNEINENRIIESDPGSEAFKATEFPTKLDGYTKANEEERVSVEKLEELFGEDQLTKQLEGKMEELYGKEGGEQPENGENAARAHMRTELKNLIDFRKRKASLASTYFSNKMLGWLRSENFGPEVRVFLRETAVVKDSFPSGRYKLSSSMNKTLGIDHGIYHNAIDFLKNVDLNFLAFTGDNSFVSGLGDKIDLLSKLEVFEDLFRYYESNATEDTNLSHITNAKAMLALLKEIRTDYEERMQRIAHPGEANGVEKVLSAKELNRRYEEKLRQIQKEDGEKAIAKLKETLKDIDTTKKPKEILDEEMERVKQEALSHYPEDDAEFLEKFKNEGMDFNDERNAADYDVYDAQFAVILEYGRYRGNPIPPKLLEKLEKGIRDYAKKRREYLAFFQATKEVSKLVYFANGVDTKNPVFANSPEGELVQGFLDEDTIGADTTAAFQECYKLADEVLYSLIRAGFTVSEKYQARMKDENERAEALEKNRAAREKKYYEDKHVPEDGNRPRIDYPKYYICGREYTNYQMGKPGATKTLELLEGLDIDLRKEDYIALHEALQIVEDTEKEEVIADRILFGAGADAGLIRDVINGDNRNLRRKALSTVRSVLRKYGIDTTKPIKSKYKPAAGKREEAKARAMAKFERDFVAKYKSAEQDLEKKRAKKMAKDHRYIANARWFLSMAAGMYQLKSVNKADAGKMYGTLTLDSEKCSVEELNQKAGWFEQIFLTIMSFDLKSLNIKNLAEAGGKRMEQERTLLLMMGDWRKEEFDQYEELISNAAVKCALTKKQLDEVRARWQLLNNLAQIFSTAVSLTVRAYELKVDLNALMDKSTDELVDLAGAERGALAEFLMALAGFKTQSNNIGYAIGDDVTAALNRIRKEKFDLPDGNRNRNSTLNALTNNKA